MHSKAFQPGALLRSAIVQTILASSRIRALGKNPMCDHARQMIFNTGGGIRLLGAYSPQVLQPPKGLVIILHGWEGSADSTYVLCAGRHLYNFGYAVVRLNYRDHGRSHHLNEGLFYAVLLDEVFSAVAQAAGLAGELPVFLVGFSLGGNFALRIGRRCLENPIPGLKYIFSISPVLDPDDATGRIDANPFIRRYFLRKWRRSLKKKQALYPDTYDFSDLMSLNSIRSMTERLLQKYSAYASAASYFRDYGIPGHALKDTAVPATILTAADDPIICVDPFYELETNDLTELSIQPFGGHNGFIQGPLLKGWYESKMISIFSRFGRYDEKMSTG